MLHTVPPYRRKLLYLKISRVSSLKKKENTEKMKRRKHLAGKVRLFSGRRLQKRKTDAGGHSRFYRPTVDQYFIGASCARPPGNSPGSAATGEPNRPLRRKAPGRLTKNNGDCLATVSVVQTPLRPCASSYNLHERAGGLPLCMFTASNVHRTSWRRREACNPMKKLSIPKV